MADDAATPPAALTPMWIIVGLAMGPAVALGLGRFAYALLLPSMRADLGWTFADAGALNTANAGGYLVGALVAAPLGKRVGEKRLFAVSMLAAALAIGASGLTAWFVALMALRAVAGFCGALGFIAGAGLASAAAAGGTASRAPTLLGVYFAGAGIGIVASALSIPPLLDQVGWRGGWLVLGALSLLATVFAAVALRRAPEPARAPADPSGAAAGRGWSPRFMAPKLVAYGLFGAGYIAYATFIIAYLRSVEGFTSAGVTRFWALFGLSSVAAAFAWGRVLARFRGGWGTACTLAVLTLGSALPLLSTSAGVAYLSAVLFGGSFLSVLAAVTSFARRTVAPHAVTSVIATLTVVFGTGQCIGPILSGALSDGPTGLRAGLWLSVIILAVATVIAPLQREPAIRKA